MPKRNVAYKVRFPFILRGGEGIKAKLFLKPIRF